jgi:hypothetical protein
LQVIELAGDAAENEIRNAHRLLVKVWEPGRFEDDPKLKKSAETKLSDINTAFEFLTSTSTDRAHVQRPVYLSSKTAPPPPGPNAAPDTPHFSARSARVAPAPIPIAAPAPAAIPDAVPPQGRWQKIKSHHQKLMLVLNKIYKFYRRVKLILTITVVLVVLLSGGSIWRTSRTHDPASRQSAQNVSFLEKIEQEMRSLAPRSPAPEADAPTAEPAPQNVKKPEKTHAAAHLAQPNTVKLKPYVTVGSTRDEVLAQQGTPTSSSEDKLVYGKSELYLKDGSVIGWRIDAASAPIRVKLWPGSAVDPTLTSFTVGSSKDVVLVVQGTPTAFTEDSFEYGGSEVSFHNNRVVSWKNDPASVPLRVQ